MTEIVKDYYERYKNDCQMLRETHILANKKKIKKIKFDITKLM